MCCSSPAFVSCPLSMRHHPDSWQQCADHTTSNLTARAPTDHVSPRIGLSYVSCHISCLCWKSVEFSLQSTSYSCDNIYVYSYALPISQYSWCECSADAQEHRTLFYILMSFHNDSVCHSYISVIVLNFIYPLRKL